MKISINTVKEKLSSIVNENEINIQQYEDPINAEATQDELHKEDRKKKVVKDSPVVQSLLTDLHSMRNGSTKNNTNTNTQTLVKNRSRKEKQQISNDIETICLLTSFSNSTFSKTFENYEIADEGTSFFKLDVQVMTDGTPDYTHWTLTESNNKGNLIIDSRFDEIKLSKNTLHDVGYMCYVTTQESQVFKNQDRLFYDFTIHEDIDGYGLCCWTGVGHVSLRLNDTIQLIDQETLFGSNEITSFYLDGEKIEPVEAQEVVNTISYPSKECIQKECFCDNNPDLFLPPNRDTLSSIFGLNVLKREVLNDISILSGYDKLLEKDTPQYKAACWILNDDPFLSNATSLKPNHAIERMMQRYVLAVFYFATNPQNWILDLDFLSGTNECTWNDYNLGTLNGIGCDKDGNMLSLLFYQNNLDGTIVDEISGLKSLGKSV